MIMFHRVKDIKRSPFTSCGKSAKAVSLRHQITEWEGDVTCPECLQEIRQEKAPNEFAGWESEYIPPSQAMDELLRLHQKIRATVQSDADRLIKAADNAACWIEIHKLKEGLTWQDFCYDILGLIDNE